MKTSVRITAIVAQLVLFFAISFFTTRTISAQSLATTYFVDSQKGNDANDGLSVPKPFKTISKARDAVRSLDKSGSVNVTVNLRGGTYFQDQTLEFTEKDGGTANCKIIYQNYKDEVPVISGGKLITGWTIFDKSKNIYRAPVKSMEFRQLYVNGKRAIRARQPNTGNNQIVAWDKPNKIVKVNKSQVSNWKNLSKVEIVTVNQFTSNHLRIASINTDSTLARITIKDTEANILNHVVGAFSYNNYWFENAYEFIDRKGEWYLNSSDGFVYYKPAMDDNMADIEVIVPYLETIVKIEGSSLDNPVQHLQFLGIGFSYATWLWPNNNGCVEYQAFHPFSTVQTELEGKYKEFGNEENFGAPAGVYVAKAESVVFDRCSFKHMGANGIKLHYGTHNCKLIGNVVFDISGNGIYEMKQNDDNLPSMAKYNPKDIREVSSNDLISNNYVSTCGVDYKGSVGIFCGYTKNVTIAHNEVCNMPYTGISVGWGWRGLKDTTVMSDNKIVDNYVHTVNNDTIMWDGGGIYTLGDQPNSLCNNNYCVSRCKGLYFDEGTGHYSISNNVVDCGHEWITFWTDQHHDNIADQNFTNTLKNMDVGTNCVIKNTIFVPDKKWPQEAKNIIKNAGLEESYKDIKDKLKPQNQRINLNSKSGK